MGEVFFISDTHFYHKNILKYSNRNFPSVEAMNEALIKNWNNTVTKSDTVWHLGDVAFCNYLLFTEIFSQLNGSINIVLGNHDKMIYENRFKITSSGLVKSIENYKELSIKDRNFILFHFPIRSWNKKHHNSIHVYGHVHGSLDEQPWGKSVDVGVDSKLITEEYRPISAQEVIDYTNALSDNIIDHHRPRGMD